MIGDNRRCLRKVITRLKSAISVRLLPYCEGCLMSDSCFNFSTLAAASGLMLGGDIPAGIIVLVLSRNLSTSVGSQASSDLLSSNYYDQT